MNTTLNLFREGVIAERSFAATQVAQAWRAEQWNARCAHLSERIDTHDELNDARSRALLFGRLAVALHILEALESDRKA